MANQSKQNGNKARVLQALTECPTFTAAAQQAGITHRALYNYLSDKEFAKAYKQQLQAQAVERAEELAAARADAIMVLQTLMNDEAQSGTVRLQASKLLLRETKDAQDQVDKISTSLSDETIDLFGF